jgi:hypothetical protein
MEEKNDLFTGLDFFLKSGPSISDNLLDTEKKEEPKAEEPEKKTAFTLEELETDSKPSTDNEEDDEEKKDTSSKKSDETETESDENESDSDNEYAKLISAMLKEKGFIEDEVEDFSKLADAFETKFENKINEYKEDLPDVIKELLDNYEDGIPLDELIDIKSEQIRLENITDEVLEDDPSIQKHLITAFYKAKGFSETKIEKLIKKAEDLDELVDEAKDALGELKEIEAEKEVKLKQETKRREAIQKAEYEKTINNLNKSITETKEILPGVKLSEKDQKELFKMITTPAEVRGNQVYTQAMIKREEDPLGFEVKLNYYIKMGLFDSTPKMDFLTKKIETKTVSKFEKQIAELAEKNFNKGTVKAQSKSDVLKALEEKFNK